MVLFCIDLKIRESPARNKIYSTNARNNPPNGRNDDSWYAPITFKSITVLKTGWKLIGGLMAEAKKRKSHFNYLIGVFKKKFKRFKRFKKVKT